ncbi:helix-turn-helix domain-containing protein [Paenibacillus thalictri]|uniref:AraC family transcriptional regulator n=1 Tax=Paenibacillus thalictri TaxID=2527873 RepID=A0A4V2J487_9BACL|nr:helix-turn-helix domain-containing protein [Paenibacillus thalictri]TBL78521.1 AraC family transcriptional regulator [Paenibacillus thalictri]
MSQTQMSIEQLLYTVDYAATQFISSGLTSVALNEVTSYLQADILREVSSELHRLQFVEFGISDASLVNLDYGWTFGNGGFQTLDEVQDRGQIFDYGGREAYSFWEKQNDTVHFVKKLPSVLNTKSPKGLLILEIPLKKFSDLISKQSRLGEVTILDLNYQPIASANAHGIDSGILDQLRQTASFPQGSLKAMSDGISHVVTYNRSAYNGWIYVSVISVREITGESRSIGWFTLFVCLTIIALTAAAAYWMSGRIYSPIRRIYEAALGVNRYEAEYRARDELDYIDNRLRQLSLNEAQMEEQIRQQHYQLKVFFAQRLFLRQITRDELQEKLKLYGLPHSWRWLSVLTLQIDTLEGTRYRDQDFDLLMFAIGNMVDELIPAGRWLNPISLDRSQVVVLLSDAPSEEEFRQELGAIAEKIKAHVAQYLNIEISIGISRPFRDLLHAPDAYEEGLAALQYRIRLGTGVILFIDEIEAKEQDPALYPRKEEKILLDAVRAGSREEARTALSEFIAEVLSREPSPQEYQLVLGELLAHLVELLHGTGRTVHQVFGEKSLFEHIISARTADETEKWLYAAVMEPLMEILDQHRFTQAVNITESVIQMIHAEYSSDLQLETCAARLNFHPVYVGRVFRKEAGCSFSEYLSKYRLMQAKSLLKETDMKISDIAGHLNYQSSATFIRYFRKMEGVTPGQYREQHALRD